MKIEKQTRIDLGIVIGVAVFGCGALLAVEALAQSNPWENYDPNTYHKQPGLAPSGNCTCPVCPRQNESDKGFGIYDLACMQWNCPPPSGGDEGDGGGCGCSDPDTSWDVPLP